MGPPSPLFCSLPICSCTVFKEGFEAAASPQINQKKTKHKGQQLEFMLCKLLLNFDKICECECGQLRNKAHQSTGTYNMGPAQNPTTAGPIIWIHASLRPAIFQKRKRATNMKYPFTILHQVHIHCTVYKAQTTCTLGQALAIISILGLVNYCNNKQSRPSSFDYFNAHFVFDLTCVAMSIQ